MTYDTLLGLMARLVVEQGQAEVNLVQQHAQWDREWEEENDDEDDDDYCPPHPKKPLWNGWQDWSRGAGGAKDHGSGRWTWVWA